MQGCEHKMDSSGLLVLFLKRMVELPFLFPNNVCASGVGPLEAGAGGTGDLNDVIPSLVSMY